MENKSFITSIEIAKSPENVFNCIKEVSKWWSKYFEGSSIKLNDEFVIHHPNAHYSKQKLVEVIPNTKQVWLGTESKLNWLEKIMHWITKTNNRQMKGR